MVEPSFAEQLLGWALYLVLGVFAVAGAASLWTTFVLRRYELPFDYDETLWAWTDDGWRLAVHRLRPAPGSPARAHPVLLVHGLGANRHNLDAPGQRSLARYLRALGYDCFLLEVRGAGMSARRARDGHAGGWTFDDLVARDVPAALARVREATGAERVHWIGHSLGGMLGYGWLAREGDARLASFTAIASPVTFAGLRRLLRVLEFLYARVPWHLTIYTAAPARVIAPFLRGRFMRMRFLANPDNLDPAVARRIVANLTENMSTALLRQFASWAHRGVFDSRDGTLRYLERLGGVRCPVLLMAADGDVQVPPASVSPAYDAFTGSVDRRFLRFGRAHGHEVEMGHGDIVLGEAAPRLVFPHVEEFLGAADRPAQRPPLPQVPAARA